MSNGVEGRIEFTANVGCDGKALQNLIHHTQNFGVAGEEKAIELNLFFHRTPSSIGTYASKCEPLCKYRGWR